MSSNGKLQKLLVVWIGPRAPDEVLGVRVSLMEMICI